MKQADAMNALVKGAVSTDSSFFGVHRETILVALGIDPKITAGTDPFPGSTAAESLVLAPVPVPVPDPAPTTPPTEKKPRGKKTA